MSTGSLSNYNFMLTKYVKIIQHGQNMNAFYQFFGVVYTFLWQHYILSHIWKGLVIMFFFYN